MTTVGGEEHPELLEIRIVGLPLGVYREAAEHHDELRREFAFIKERQSDSTDVPHRLLTLIDELNARYGSFTAGPSTQLHAALTEGLEGTIDLVYRVPPQVRDGVAEFDRLLDEADRYCAAGDELLTLAAPPRALAFRRWFLGEFVRQVDGAPPTPWSEYELQAEARGPALDR